MSQTHTRSQKFSPDSPWWWLELEPSLPVSHSAPWQKVESDADFGLNPGLPIWDADIPSTILTPAPIACPSRYDWNLSVSMSNALSHSLFFESDMLSLLGAHDITTGSCFSIGSQRIVEATLQFYLMGKIYVAESREKCWY